MRQSRSAYEWGTVRHVLDNSERPAGKLPRFALLSGIGWLLDFCIFNILAYTGTPVFAANLIGASCGVMFVFATGRRFLFRDAATRLHHAIALYIIWNIVAIFVASMLISAVSHAIAILLATPPALRVAAAMPEAIDLHRLIPPAAKIAVTPLTMYANYLAMGLINDRRFTLY